MADKMEHYSFQQTTSCKATNRKNRTEKHCQKEGGGGTSPSKSGSHTLNPLLPIARWRCPWMHTMSMSPNSRTCTGTHSLTQGGWACLQQPTTSSLQLSLSWAALVIACGLSSPVICSTYLWNSSFGLPLLRFPCCGQYKAYFWQIRLGSCTWPSRLNCLSLTVCINGGFCTFSRMTSFLILSVLLIPSMYL